MHVLPSLSTHRCFQLERCRARRDCIANEWNQVVLSEEFRFNLGSDDNRVCVWRPRGECLNPVFALQWPTASITGVVVKDAISYNTPSPLILIHDTTWQPRGTFVTFCSHMDCHSWKGSLEPFFNRTMLTSHRKGSTDLSPLHSSLPWLTRSLDLSPIEHVWNALGSKLDSQRV
ncbi:transposable element Tcb2 transposase [Trichonephila clavipes]|nr:transposable element Tcb2 transposase [Trichonephila clavipes]